MYSEFVFITDSHFKLKSSVRTGDYFEDLCAKLQWVVNYCNANNAVLLHGGDWFDTPAVPDIVKNRMMKILNKCSAGVYGIRGNHCELYGSGDHLDRTSYGSLVASGIVTDLSDSTLDLGSVILTNEYPIHDFHKPCIGLYHAFLNQEDGHNTFRFTDIESTDSDTFILLGHDHQVYDPIQFTSHVRILRPGSFARTTRADENFRNPNLIHIKVDGSKLKCRTVPIQCRDFNEVFTTQEASVSTAEHNTTYQDLISKIAEASNTQLSFSQALSSVAQPDVYEFVMRTLQEARSDSQFKRQNL